MACNSCGMIFPNNNFSFKRQLQQHLLHQKNCRDSNLYNSKRNGIDVINLADNKNTNENVLKHARLLDIDFVVESSDTEFNSVLMINTNIPLHENPFDVYEDTYNAMHDDFTFTENEGDCFDV